MLTMNTLRTGDAEAIRKEILDINLSNLSDLIADAQYRNFFLAGPGRENYKLIASIASLFPGQKVFDLGTYFGLASVAMSMNPEVQVISYDTIERKRLTSLPTNITYNIGDPLTDPELLKSPFIFIDLEPHDGINEQIMHNFFVDNKYQGVVVWANINCNAAMTGWWVGLTYKRADITNAGHWAGTGLMIYE